MNREPIMIRKASGEEEAFQIEKLRFSLQKAGTESIAIKEIIEEVQNWIVEGVSTKAIYSKAFSLLKKRKTKAAFRYKLKNAILQFGATGYPFEKLIGQMFTKLGYDVQVGIEVEVKCIVHEIDVMAENENQILFMECKYSPNHRKQINIQTPLYVQARMADVIAAYLNSSEKEHVKELKGYLVSNSRFSSTSLEYSKCAEIDLLSFTFPPNANLQDMMEKAEIYPVTLLSNLSSKEKRLLIEQGIVICSQLAEKKEVLKTFQLSAYKEQQLYQELALICGS